MIKKFLTAFIIIAFVLAPVNFAGAKKVKTLSQLERRNIETRLFDTPDSTKVMKAAVNTLQDSGFVLQEIEPELGYLRARKYYKKRYLSKGRVALNSFLFALFATYAVFTYGMTSYYVVDPARKINNEFKDKTVVIDSNVNVEPFGQNKTKVRLVLVQKVLQNADGYSFVKSAPVRVFRVYQPEVYREFFAQLDKSIFYEGI